MRQAKLTNLGQFIKRLPLIDDKLPRHNIMKVAVEITCSNHKKLMSIKENKMVKYQVKIRGKDPLSKIICLLTSLIDDKN